MSMPDSSSLVTNQQNDTNTASVLSTETNERPETSSSNRDHRTNRTKPYINGFSAASSNFQNNQINGNNQTRKANKQRPRNERKNSFPFASQPQQACNRNNQQENRRNDNQNYSLNSQQSKYNSTPHFSSAYERNDNDSYVISSNSNNQRNRFNNAKNMFYQNDAFTNQYSNQPNSHANQQRKPHNFNNEAPNSKSDKPKRVRNQNRSNKKESENKKSQRASNIAQGDDNEVKKTNAQQSKSSAKNKELSKVEFDGMNMRTQVLIDQLRNNKCECLVCCLTIRHDKAIWSCDTCFHIFHLYCIKKWASSKTAKLEENCDMWRCPGCQNLQETIPNKYTCFCKKKINPEHSKESDIKSLKAHVPHTCGEICGKRLDKSYKFWMPSQKNESNDETAVIECNHKCTKPCHPGPCELCEAIVSRSCLCGKNTFQVKCTSLKIPSCNSQCDLLLNCGIHKCNKSCHVKGECGPCEVDVEQTCYSHQTSRTLKCGDARLGTGNFYTCNEKCNKLLACGNHYCQQSCHEGECQPCSLLPSNLQTCPCGRTKIRELLLARKLIRTSCKDPVPVCENTCNRVLHEFDNETHRCEHKCHEGECPPCTRVVDVKCRCGRDTEEMICNEREAKGEILCKRRCNKKKTCGRHQCTNACCNDRDHICTQLCNRPLACGNHNCEQLCHKGLCPRCLVADFNERICHCGKTVEYPPIRCGSKPLECKFICTREHACNHEVLHSCHWEEKCPPCGFLTSKMCMGNHEMRHNIPCSVEDVSCGRACNKPLKSCSHLCNKTCHKGECLEEGEKCMQPCQKPRTYCQHPCSAPCHPDDEPCPNTACQTLIVIKCKCGLKSQQVKCMQRAHEPVSNIVFENLASEIKEMLSCKSIDVSSFNKTEAFKRRQELECDEDCILEERNRNFANALQIDLSSSTGKQLLQQQMQKPIYSEFLKTYAREDLNFVIDLEKQFEQLIKETQQLRVTGARKSINMPVMKSYERKFIHELAAYYNIETMSQNNEPLRYVTVTAVKDKSYVPIVTLFQSVNTKARLNVFNINSMGQTDSTSSSMTPLASFSSMATSTVNSKPKPARATFNGSDKEEEYQNDLECLLEQSTLSRSTKLNITNHDHIVHANEIDYFDMTD